MRFLKNFVINRHDIVRPPRQFVEPFQLFQVVDDVEGRIAERWAIEGRLSALRRRREGPGGGAFSSALTPVAVVSRSAAQTAAGKDFFMRGFL
ncbi:hypothetical protein [Paraburkholderia tropica]|uniref:hypothetical protein n=1 Tax=Paraburkholderia tropica TaxID=92647 RepID=UPI002AB078EF|nr:hypothetical protein [Paraburkholderia tropica]